MVMFILVSQGQFAHIRFYFARFILGKDIFLQTDKVKLDMVSTGCKPDFFSLTNFTHVLKVLINCTHVP